MKRSISIGIAVACMATLTVQAQTLNVRQGQVTYAFTAQQAGTMTYADGGQTLTIGGKTFNTAEIDKMEVNTDKVTNNQVTVNYNGTSASVVVAGNVARYVAATVSGAHVNISQTNTDDVDGDEISYSLAGTSSDGEFYLEGNYKCSIDLNGLTLTNATPVSSGAAIHIQNGKRISISSKNGTENTLRDAAGGDQKGCLYVKGHAELKGKGTLNVYGNAKHAIKAGEYVEMKNCTVNVLAAAGDGISCNEYFLISSGTLNISGVSDDGIQCDIDGDSSTGPTTDHEDEDSGNIYIEGGAINIGVTADAAKAIKAEGDLTVSDGTITCTTTGNGTWSEDTTLSTGGKTKASTCLSADGNMTISGGTLSLSSTGHGGKGISTDGALTISGGSTTISTTGGRVVYINGTLYNGYTGDDRTLEHLDSNYKSSAKGIKADGDISISGGTISVTTTGLGGEGIESKAVLTISDGEVTCNTYDDGINSKSHMYIKGGYVYARSTNNDGLDANGNCYIQGGVIYAIGGGGAEVAIDANTESNYKLYVTGGTIFAIGGLERGASISGGTCMSVSSWNANTWYALYNGNSLVGAFKTPATSSTQPGMNQAPGQGGPGGPGGGMGGGQQMVVYTTSTPSLTSGVSVSGGTSIWNGQGNTGCTVSGGSGVSLGTYR